MLSKEKLRELGLMCCSCAANVLLNQILSDVIERETPSLHAHAVEVRGSQTARQASPGGEGGGDLLTTAVLLMCC